MNLNQQILNQYPNAFGSTPGAIGNPTSLYSQANSAIPGLGKLGTTAVGAATDFASGKVPQDVLDQIKNQAATWGVTSGMPGSGASNSKELESLGLTSLGLEQQGVQDYSTLLSGIAGTQLDPSLQTEIANRNSIYAAAPNPESASLLQMGLATGNIGGGYNPSGNSGGMPAQPAAANFTPAGSPYSFYSFGSGNSNVDFGGGGTSTAGIGGVDYSSLLNENPTPDFSSMLS